MLSRIAGGIGAGLVASALILWLAGFARPRHVKTRLVAEDASAPLETVAIHYAPAADAVALGVYQQLFAALRGDVQVEVEVAAHADYVRFAGKLREWNTPNLGRFHEVIVGTQITTWSRDRYAALVDESGRGSILAPPRSETPFASREGDARSPVAISRALYHRDPRVADILFEGGDLAATPDLIFADVNLVHRNRARGEAGRPAIEAELHAQFAQQLVWLGDEVGDVPRHHIMMYMVPLDDHTIAVGDERAGVALLGKTDLELDDVDVQAARFDRAAAMLTARGFDVVRVPAVVLAGGGAYITYTNALFDRRDGTRVVYLPTYSQPALDAAAVDFYVKRGYEVHPIDVSPIYRLDGSLGCLVNVIARM